MSYSNLNAVTKAADDDAIAGRTRVAAIYYTCLGTASSFQLKNGSTTAAPTLVDIKTPGAAGAYDIIFPDMGVLFSDGVFIELENANVSSVTLFFYGGAAA
jgi:hypothetical protein